MCIYSHWTVNSEATVCLFSLSLDDSFLWALFPSQQQTLGAGDIGRIPIRKATFRSINSSHMYSFPWTTVPQPTVDSRGWPNPDRDYSKLEGKELGTDKQWESRWQYSHKIIIKYPHQQNKALHKKNLELCQAVRWEAVYMIKTHNIHVWNCQEIKDFLL